MLNKVWRLLFRLLYNEFAYIYDRVSCAVSLGQWRDWQRAALDMLPAADAGLVLELAHGTGDLQIDLIRAGYQTVALDQSARMGSLASRKLRRAGLPANLIRGDAFQLPCKSGTFAAIVCTFPASFIFNELVLAELARLLRPSGRVVIALVGQLSGGGVLRAAIRRLYRLTGQRDGLFSQGALADLFVCRSFDVAAEIVTLPGSAVQLAVLTKVAGRAALSPEPGLETETSL